MTKKGLRKAEEFSLNIVKAIFCWDDNITIKIKESSIGVDYYHITITTNLSTIYGDRIAPYTKYISSIRVGARDIEGYSLSLQFSFVLSEEEINAE